MFVATASLIIKPLLESLHGNTKPCIAELYSGSLLKSKMRRGDYQ